MDTGYTRNEQLRQVFDEHWQEFCDYWASRTRDASQIEQVGMDTEKITGVLMCFDFQGVRKIVRVTPAQLVDELTLLEEEIRQRCIDAAEGAEAAAGYASGQGDYAKSEGDRVDALIGEITELKARVKEQGDTAELQGNTAEALMKEVRAWYVPFKEAAEGWLSAIRQDVDAWYSSVKAEWDAWFAARKQDWNTWFSDTTSSWSAWSSAVKSGWDTWFEAARAYVSEWGRKEQERQSAEEIRLEMQAHPPVPSERGYWMFWDVDTHDYVESGYSSRGTMDWPEFFWDYETMGIGVVTTRDYSRFFIDEKGRFGMYM